ncbi:MAG: hypothetical protein DRR04_04515 [Gammaproteobacteria bacterium]|nr:MAG: hypothetical protein DRR04_04515 [Gammaproteobacteria bacterium]
MSTMLLSWLFERVNHYNKPTTITEVVTLLKWTLTLGGILLMFGCADPIEDAKKTLETGLFQNIEVEYRNIQSFPGDVVCGEINSFDRWGNSPGYKRFIVRADRASLVPVENDWGIFCSEDPVAALQARFGIDPMNGKNSTLQTVHRHLSELDFALRQYLTDNAALPLTTQELASASTTGPQPKNRKEGGYIDKIPEDPWGRPYHYEKLRRLHPAPKTYKLYTLGRDGVAGGTGEDADIGNWQLKYLDHIVSL